ncbi:MAG: TonB-dependent receptor, partial [Proteobacteria bacterium]|nr:TonB-dependent receptor [Pseudomonadota bacterium]
VLFERDSRGLAEEEGTHGRVSFSASSNSTKGDVLADGMFAVEEKGYLRLITEIKTMDDYEDGDGRTVRSSFEHKQGGIILGFTPTEDRLFELSLERNEFSDALYPGAGMDSPEESGDIIRLKFEDKPNLSWLSSVKIETYLSDVDHVMNNFSLRNPPKYMMGPAAGQDMTRETVTESTTVGGRIQLTSNIGTMQWHYGIDIQNNQRDASLNNMDSGNAKAISLMWPDANINQTGMFAEAEQKISKKERLKYGLRLDFVTASADKANIKPIAGPKTASQVYEMYYGSQETDQDETN